MRRLRPSWPVIATALLAIAAMAGGLVYRHQHRYKHFAVHDPGRVYRSAWVDADVVREIVETYRIRTVVNLCFPGEMGETRWIEERRAVAESGARLLELSMPELSDPTDPDYRPHIEALSNADNFPMLIHCQHGVRRTAKLLLLYDVLNRGMSADRSLAQMPLFGRENHGDEVVAFARQLFPPRERLGTTQE